MRSLLKCTFVFDAFVDAMWTYISKAALISSGLLCFAVNVKFTLTGFRSQFAVTQLMLLLHLVQFGGQCYIYSCRLIELKVFISISL